LDDKREYVLVLESEQFCRKLDMLMKLRSNCFRQELDDEKYSCKVWFCCLVKF